MIVRLGARSGNDYQVFDTARAIRKPRKKRCAAWRVQKITRRTCVFPSHKNAASSGVVTILLQYIVYRKKHAGPPFIAVLHRLVLG